MNDLKEKNILQLAQSYARFGPRAMFGQFMMDIAKSNEKLMVLSADLGRSSGLDRFKKEYPEKYLSVGISEQNLIGVSAGLAKEGYKVLGITLKLYDDTKQISQSKQCCAGQDIMDAKRVANKLEIEHKILYYQNHF